MSASLCAISFSWCGKMRSNPPPCTSNGTPSSARDIALHSMCQPGRPAPHGAGHDGSPGLANFQSAKSSGSRLCSFSAIRAPISSSSTFFPDRAP
jgi:hypothetical protein